MGANDLDGLKQVIAVRNAALKRLSIDAIHRGEPVATIEDVLVPTYLYHRYQVSAVSKSIGGLNYWFNVRGGVETPPEIVPAAQQRAAIRAVLATLSPQQLEFPAALLKQIPPRPPEYPSSKENFARRTAPAFDSLSGAEALADIVSTLLLEPNRDERLVEYHAQDAQYPGFAELIDDLLTATWKAQPEQGYDGAIQRRVDAVVLDHLMSLAADQNAAPQTRAVVSLKLDGLKNWIAGQLKTTTDETRRAQLFFSVQQIEQFEKNPTSVHISTPAPPPAGDPIGSDGWD